MKKIKYIFLILLMGIVQSCDWLDLTPEDTYSIDNYWNSKDQVDRFIRGLHVRVRSRQNIFFQMGEVRGGTLDSEVSSLFSQAKSDIPAISNTLAEDKTVISDWGNFYMDIMQINHAIERVPATTFLSETEKNYDLGILYGLRAFYYFQLFRTYGGVPIVDSPEVLGGVSSPSVLNKERSSEEQVYAFVLNDVLESEKYFENDKYTVNSTDQNSAWTKGATKMLKAEVLLWGCKVKPIGGSNVYSKNVSSDLTAAKAALNDVRNSGKFNLLDDFSQVFASDNKNNKEIIFAIRYALNEATNIFNRFLYPQANGNLKGYQNEDGSMVYGENADVDILNLAGSGSISQYQYASEFFKTFSKDDARRKNTFMDVYRVTDKATAILLVKFMGELDESKIRRFTSDWPIYRYADLLLMMAEIEQAQGGDPAPYINEIRKRAYGEAYEAHKYPHAGETAENAILEERTKEFVAEGKRWYDIRRMKDGEVAKQLQTNVNEAAVKEQHLLWPLNAEIMAKDPLVKQTQGY